MEYIKRYTLFTGFYKINFSCIIMPQDILTDLNNLDLNKPTVDIEAIRTVIPHRYEMEQLNGIIKFDPENKIIIGYKDISNSEFWVRGHIPGRPLMPGVIMLEAAAQLCTYYYKKNHPGRPIPWLRWYRQSQIPWESYPWRQTHSHCKKQGIAFAQGRF